MVGAVVDDADAVARAHEVGTVERAVDAERLREAGRTGAEVAVGAPAAAAPHDVEPGERRAARSNTACGVAPGPHTAFAHQCMP